MPLAERATSILRDTFIVREVAAKAFLLEKSRGVSKSSGKL